MATPFLASGARTSPFTFTVRLDRDAYEAMEIDCASEAAAIEAAREVLQAQIDHRPALAGPAQRGLVGVGAGSMLADPDKVIWLGEWEWSPADGWYWQSSD